MNIDLLGDDSNDNVEHQNILRPTIRRQQSNTSAIVTQFAQLNLTSSANTSDTVSTAAVNCNNNVDEEDDFGEFLQSEAVDDKCKLSEKHQMSVTSGIISEHVDGDEILPFSLPQPPPPASSSRPSFDVRTQSGGKIRSRRGTIVDENTLLNGQPLKDTMANQLQNWISGSENIPSSNSSMDYNESMIDIPSVWESAEGLMGGNNPSTHITEIATRLCNTIPSGSQHEQTNESLSSISIPLADSIEKSIDHLLSQKSPETFYQLLSESNITQQSYNLIWPLYSNTNSTDEETDLTNAYLRLTKIIESSTENESSTRSQSE
ncbi:hypothetical protein COEREDRAFT_97096 [Coemansia reversa NRRL 1564]|uniref:Uncharacterized protein n=1 Tax=Coemansia reversa (strain ATCC 12441 / NRRL 1564) TaxID=763665 RepID=A0A2G5BCQ2_COERN|nr:hypothetical protein COEREDRAFT_97096 [Coemansia reversa NRRL 1564]|eukprot:PIA16781.1 hypothetical protein COEREDRAFT_97096 [Coemansia reversa NRRL 1564]